MSKRNRNRAKKKQAEEPPEEEPSEEEQAPEEPEETQEEESEPTPEEAPEEPAEPKEEPAKISKKLLIVGTLLSLSGVFGFLGLRSGLIQLVLGITDPYPGIGSLEPSGHIVSSVPFVLGIVIVAVWGIRNDPIYREIERSKKEDADEPETEPEDIPEKEAEYEDAPEEEETLPEEFTEPLPEETEEIVEPDSVFDELDDINDIEIEDIPAEPAIAPSSVKSHIAEDMKRAENCEKMLSAAVVLPDDKAHLRKLIDSGISFEEFASEVKAAVERRKKREQEKDISAAEKASILEDELVSELAALEDLDAKDLEDAILKELDDLGDL